MRMKLNSCNLTIKYMYGSSVVMSEIVGSTLKFVSFTSGVVAQIEVYIFQILPNLVRVRWAGGFYGVGVFVGY